MSVGKKIWKFISSMRFAIILLVILAAACSASSFITQGQSFEWYAARYSERTAALILALRLDDAFHSGWFVLISAFLCLNLLLCNVLRLPGLIARTRTEGSVEAALRGECGVSAGPLRDAEGVFRRLRMPAPRRGHTEDGREVLFSSRGRTGLWGAWVCHLGILLLILGFGLGQMTQRQYAVYGVPGQTKPVGDSGLLLTIDDFRVDLRADDTVEQYTADITVRGADGTNGESARISVNNPAALFGMKFYQNSTGWAGRVRVLEAGEPLQDEVICAGEFLAVQDKPELVIYLNAFYPDFVMDPRSGPATASGRPDNPAWLYTVYYMNEIIGMNVLTGDETITIDDYEVIFSDPQSYTVIQVKRDSFAWLALLGGVITTLGLALAFYVQPTKVWAVRDAEGGWTAFGSCPKGGAVFRNRFLRAARTNGKGEREGGAQNASG